MKYRDLKIHPITFLLFVLPFFVSASLPAIKISRSNDVIFILPPPPPPIITYGGPYCANAANLTPTVTNFVSSSAIFFSQPGGLNLNSSNGQINTSLSTPGTYTVSLFDNGPGGCNCTVKTVVQINALPQLQVSGSFSVCKGSTAQLIATGPNIINFSWSNGSTGSSIMFTPSVTTIITVTATGVNGCKSNKPQTITVKPTPTISVQGFSVCAGSPATLIATSRLVAGNVSYVWSPGQLQGNPVVVSPQQTTVYQVIGTLDGCQSQASTYQMLVVPSTSPEVYFSYITPLCSNSGDPLPILSGSFATGGVFASPDGSLRVNPNTGRVDFSNMTPGGYSVTYTLAAVGCSLGASSEASLLVNAGGNLTADPLLIITEGESVNLNVSGGAAYAWDPVDFLSCTDCENPVATPLVTTKYCATDITDGCILKACTDVVVLCQSNADFVVPNAFTPNGDKNNDEFCLKGWTYCVTDFKIIIYDRWGEKVYESTDPEFCWDGKFNGEVLNSGVYVYAISAKVNRETKIKKGNITLMR